MIFRITIDVSEEEYKEFKVRAKEHGYFINTLFTNMFYKTLTWLRTEKPVIKNLEVK